MIFKEIYLFFFLKKVPHNLSNIEENRPSLGQPGLTPVYPGKPGPRFPLVKASLCLPGTQRCHFLALTLGKFTTWGLVSLKPRREIKIGPYLRR